MIDIMVTSVKRRKVVIHLPAKAFSFSHCRRLSDWAIEEIDVIIVRPLPVASSSESQLERSEPSAQSDTNHEEKDPSLEEN